jgi:maleylacetoacetate isomerase/maleylpyruvate isomerase
MAVILYSYWRSSAAYRVRLALALKGVAYEYRALDLRHGAQSAADYLALNPQGLVPMLVDGDMRLSQSLAIIDYLDGAYPEPRLIPTEPQVRAKVQAAALTIACDVHPLNNLRVLRYLRKELSASQEAIDEWARHWIASGFEALERSCAKEPGPYLFGASPSLADVCLVPQIYNARRVDTDLSGFPRLLEAEAAFAALPAYEAAKPENQPDA